MKVSVIRSGDLDDGLIERWQQLQALDVTLRSPFYHVGFTQLVARHREAVRIAVIEINGTVCAFLPHELDSHGRLMPVGCGLNDYHGLIADFEVPFSTTALLKACGARYWHFDHMPLAQSQLATNIRMLTVSPAMDISGGHDAYVARLVQRNQGKKPSILTSLRKASNRLGRDSGPLRFVWDERDGKVLTRLMELKSDQWQRTAGSSHDAFAIPWIRNMMVEGHSMREPAFCGTLSALYAGDTLVASHFGFRAGPVLHGSFATYEPTLAYYMPGSLLLQQFATEGSANGVAVFDMGRGTQDYKMRLSTSSIPIGEGAVSRPPFVAHTHMALKQMRVTAKARLKSMPMIAKLHAYVKAKAPTNAATED